jgi:hypothetical protein
MTKTAPHLGEELSGTVDQVADLARTAGKKLDESTIWQTVQRPSWLALLALFGPPDAKDPRQSTIWRTAQRPNWIRLPHTSGVMIRRTCSATCSSLFAVIQPAFSLGRPLSGSSWDLPVAESRTNPQQATAHRE